MINISAEASITIGSNIAARGEKGNLRSLVTTTLRRGWDFISDNVTARSTRELVSSMRILHVERLDEIENDQKIIHDAVKNLEETSHPYEPPPVKPVTWEDLQKHEQIAFPEPETLTGNEPPYRHRG